MLILNDIHIGTARKAGTTPASQEALRGFIFSSFETLLGEADDHLVINGDLFDRFEVEAADLIRTYGLFETYLLRGGTRLTLVAGNHDWSPRAGKVSSFHVLAHFLMSRFPDHVRLIDHQCGLSNVGGVVFAIPHMPNQDLFDLEIGRATGAKAEGAILLLHANLENGHTEDADHSLNVGSEQVKALLDAGWTLVFAHEHQQRTAHDGRVIVVGNQIPTSVADCLGTDGKYTLRVLDGKPELVRLFDINMVFARTNWRDLDAAPEAKFIRVEGEATAEEAAEVVDAVAAFRQKSDAFVVSNSVRVEGMAEFDQLAEMSFEQVSSFNVLDALLAELSEEEGRVVKELLDAA